MRNINLFFTLFLSLLICISCNRNDEKEPIYEKVLYKPLYSSNFEIRGDTRTQNSLIEVYNPWQGAKNVSSHLLISRDSIVPENFKGQVIKGEPKRIVCMSSTHIAMLDTLNCLDVICGVSGSQYVSNPKIAASSNFIPDIGYEGNINYEALVASRPDLILMFSINGASSMEPKLKELGIPFLYIGDYVEENPLGKAEWIVALSEVLGKREEGVEIFNGIAKRYEILKKEISSKILYRPKVMVNAPFLDSWFMPSRESYIAKMIEDAGGDYIYEKNTGTASKPIDKEEALQLVSQADYWINIGTINSKQELINSFPWFVNLDCVKNGNIFNNNLRRTPGGGNDCFESGVVHPDIVLQDMAKIFHPELIEAPFYYYQCLK